MDAVWYIVSCILTRSRVFRLCSRDGCLWNYMLVYPFYMAACARSSFLEYIYIYFSLFRLFSLVFCQTLLVRYAVRSLRSKLGLGLFLYRVHATTLCCYCYQMSQLSYAAEFYGWQTHDRTGRSEEEIPICM